MSPARNAGEFSRIQVSISALTRIELLRSIIWYRGKVKIESILTHSRRAASASRSHARELPRELLDAIIAHVLLDTPTLKACSAVCRSWYIATVLHLHHTLTLQDGLLDPTDGVFIRFRKLAKAGLLPLVKRLWIQQNFTLWFLPTRPNAQRLACFSMLKNVQELGIDSLDLHVFTSTPQAQLSFGQFATRLRSLTLRWPRGARRELIYFLGLFPNLDDLKLTSDWCLTQKAPPGAVSVPRSAPPLRGGLVLAHWAYGKDFLRDLSALSGGLRFHHAVMTGMEPEYARFLLDRCAESLKTLRICVSDLDRTREHEVLLRGFDLSNNTSLRSLEVTMEAILRHPKTTNFLKDLLPTITSPVFSDIVIVVESGTIQNPHPSSHVSFELMRHLYEVKPFRLVFCLEVWDGDREVALRRLKEYIDGEAAKGVLEFLPCPPLIISNTQSTQQQLFDRY